MYVSMVDDIYECDFCGVQMKWDETNEKRGTMWECEKCGRHFCDRCFMEKHGGSLFPEMLRGPQVLCPDCYGGAE